jgi:hypothetical protein
METYLGALNLSTPHPPEAYPGIFVVRVGPEWSYAVICPQVGQTITARGGESACGYTTPEGGVAQPFSLRPGDRATLLRSGLEHQLCEWRIERTIG